MKLRRLFVCGWLLFFCSTSLFASKAQGPSSKGCHVPKGPLIKVLLERDVPSAFLEAKGSYRVVRKDRGTTLSQGTQGKRFVVHALQDGLRWGEEYPDVYQIALIPLSDSTFFYVDGVQYKGAISVYHVRDNRITIVNEVPIEDYLKSTLTIQYDESISREALSAMAIVARTEAYKIALKGRSTTCPWDITAEKAGYFGHGISCRGLGVDEAVDWSRFMVMESIKQGTLAENIHLIASRANELAKQGCDAQQILKTAFPATRIGSTITPDEVAIR